jgi:hypothetical protein
MLMIKKLQIEYVQYEQLSPWLVNEEQGAKMAAAGGRRRAVRRRLALLHAVAAALARLLLPAP